MKSLIQHQTSTTGYHNTVVEANIFPSPVGVISNSDLEGAKLFQTRCVGENVVKHPVRGRETYQARWPCILTKTSAASQQLRGGNHG